MASAMVMLLCCNMHSKRLVCYRQQRPEPQQLVAEVAAIQPIVRISEIYGLNSVFLFNFFSTALSGLDFSAIQVPNSTSSGSLSAALSGALGGSLSPTGQSQPQPPLSIGANDDPAMVREAFFKNPDQLALVSSVERLKQRLY